MNGGSGFDSGFSNSIGGTGFNQGFSKRRSVVTSGLVFHFDVANGSYSGAGSTLIDLSGNGRNGTLFNSPSYSTDSGGLLRYVKTSFQYATVPNPGNLTNWTVESWVKFNALPLAGPNAIVTGQYDLSSKLNFTLGSIDNVSNSIRAGFFDGAWRYNSSGQSVVVGTWYHLLGTYDGSSVKIYSNGSLLNSVSYAGTPQSGGEVRIARRWDSADNDSGNFISADIPVVRVYSRALTNDEVAINFGTHRGRYNI